MIRIKSNIIIGKTMGLVLALLLLIFMTIRCHI